MEGGETSDWDMESPGIVNVQAVPRSPASTAPGTGGSAVLARCQQIIVILLPRLNQRVIKSGSMLPWDFFFFFFGRNHKLKKP